MIVALLIIIILIMWMGKDLFTDVVATGIGLIFLAAWYLFLLGTIIMLFSGNLTTLGNTLATIFLLIVAIVYGGVLKDSTDTKEEPPSKLTEICNILELSYEQRIKVKAESIDSLYAQAIIYRDTKPVKGFPDNRTKPTM